MRGMIGDSITGLVYWIIFLLIALGLAYVLYSHFF